MAMQRLMSVCAVNIRLQPHPAGSYFRLFEMAMNLKRPISIHGMTHMIMTRLKKEQVEGREALTGEIAKYTRIHFDKKWFNELTMSVAEEDDLVEVNIPDHLQPNFSAFRFVFFPDGHVAIVEHEADGERLSPNFVGKYFSKLLSADVIGKALGVVDVTVLPDPKGVQSMLSLPVIKKVEMKIRRPNPDDFDDIDDDDIDAADAQILMSMNNQAIQ